MRAKSAGTKTWLLGSALLLSSTLLAGHAEAAQHNGSDRNTIRPTASFHAHHLNARLNLASGARVSHAMHLGGRRFAARSYGISCVPYARSVSGIELKGNAANWWAAAAGVYERGSQPEPGSVMNFRATGHMRLGHVAVVERVVNSREVEIDHANWVENVSMNFCTRSGAIA